MTSAPIPPFRTRSHGGVRGLGHVHRSSIDGARFGRMFRDLPGETYSAADLTDLAKVMIQLEHAAFRSPPTPTEVVEGPDTVFNADPALDTVYGEPEAGDENPTIPAGYTYFGQFIDHDLTFDPGSSMQKQNDPDATTDFRTPRFDLDSLYGRGPDDQPYLYKNAPADGGGIRFLLGRNPDGSERRGELPRNVEGRALVGDPRNDENDIICQMQIVWLNFHNRVIDTLAAMNPPQSDHDIFLTAQRIVRWHYQYLVLNDYLPRIVGEETWNRVFQGSGARHPEPHLQFYRPKKKQAYMPVEFSVAAFRFGHTMVRPSYALRPGDAVVGGDAGMQFPGDPARRFHRVPIFSDVRTRGANLSGFGPLPPDWEIDWNMFFSAGAMPVESNPAGGDDPGVLRVQAQGAGHLTQPSYRIDAQIVDPLAMLPPTVAKSGNMPDGIPSLAFRNLLRGSAFELPSGQSVARKLGVPVIDEATIWGGYTGAKQTRAFATEAHNPFRHRAPLWFYILRESEQTFRQTVPMDTKGGHFLGPVGGRIVAEVLVGIAVNDDASYLNQQPGWTPAAEKARSGFSPDRPIKTMYDLICWTTGGSMTFRPQPAALSALAPARRELAPAG